MIMKVPKYIVEMLELCLKYNRKAGDLMQNIEGWMTAHGLDVEAFRDGGGHSLEEIEYGNDVIDELVDWMNTALAEAKK